MADKRVLPSKYAPVTARAVCIGLFLSLVIDLWMLYNDYYLQNTLLIGNHFPIASIALLVFLVLGVNVAVKRTFGAGGLDSGELLLIWGMIGVAGGICSAGFMRYFPTWVIMPAYYASPSNEYAGYLLAHMPDWMIVGRDPNDPAVLWFMEGLPKGGTIPWGRWILPMTAWFGFMLLLYAAVFSFCALLYRQWALRERLIFPIVHLPVELSQPPEVGRLANAFVRNPLTWVGIGIPMLIHGANGLGVYVPGIPKIPLSWGTWGLFPDRPWSEFNMETAYLFFSVLGLVFLLTTQMAFSLWFFFFLYRLSYVYSAWLGAAGAGFWGNWWSHVTVFQAAGSLFVLVIFLFWTARSFLREWLARVVAGHRDPELDPMPPRLTFVLILLGVTGMMLWFVLAGASWGMSILAVLIYMGIILLLTRIVAESGLLFVQSNVVPWFVLTGLFPPAWLTGPTLNALMMHRAITMHDLREILMPYVINGMKACDMVRMRVGRVLGVFAATAVFALLISAYGRIATHYKYGGINLDQYANIEMSDVLEATANFQKNPPAYDFLRIGDTKILPVSGAHVAIGAALTGLLLVLRARFLWWPLHPFGYLLCGSWAITNMWFSIFLGWLAKSCVMTFGGPTVYRRVLPFFLGLVLGESLIAALWMVVSIFTGVRGQPILPN